MAASKKMKFLRQSFTFAPNDIDAAAELITTEAEAYGISRKDALRLRLSMEEVLLTWKDAAVAESYTVELTFRWGRMTLTLRSVGQPCSITQADTDEDYGSGDLGRAMLENLGLALAWHYRDGCNVISCSVRRKRKFSQFQQVLAAVISALVLGAVMPNTWGTVLLSTLVDPLFNTFLGVFSCIVGPMMFLSMIWGIVNIGDAKQLGTIGKKLILRFLTISTLFGSVCMAAALAAFRLPFGSQENGQAVIQSVVEMVLDIIPSNVVEPFASGNTLQILCMGIVVGVVMIFLRDRLQVMLQTVEQSNAIVQMILGAVSSMMPGFIFLSVLRLMLQGTLAEIASGLVQVILLCVGLSVLEVIAETLSMIKLGISPLQAARICGKTFLVALTTASSAATLPIMTECCVDRLGIDKKLVHFALPFGSVVFMPHVVNAFILVPLYAASIYGIEMTVGSVILCVINAVILSVAAPPIPGGALSCFTLMFLQLGIPLEAVSFAVAANVVLDFTMTAGQSHALVVQLTHAAKQLGMLDEETLRKSL